MLFPQILILLADVVEGRYSQAFQDLTIIPSLDPTLNCSMYGEGDCLKKPDWECTWWYDKCIPPKKNLHIYYYYMACSSTTGYCIIIVWYIAAHIFKRLNNLTYQD